MKKHVPKLVYADSPSRLVWKKDEMMTFIAYHGNAGLHPFNSFPYHYYEGGIIGRDVTMRWCRRLIDICDEFWLFGISEGTLTELRYFIESNKSLKQKKVFRTFVREFDPDWQKYLEEYKEPFADVIPLIKLA
jgi:hypothetical protein